MKRSTPTARRVSSGRSDQPQPPDRCPVCEAIKLHSPDGCPADEAINPNRQTGARCAKRSNSTRRTGVQREKDQRQLQPPNWTEDEGPSVNSVVSVRAACEGPTSNSASAAFPLGLSPCNRDHAPRFLWSETVVKAKQCHHYCLTVPALSMPWKRYGPSPLIQVM